MRLADAHQPQDLRWGHSGPVSELYDAFVKGGGVIWVCPHCADAAGVKQVDLRPGAKMGKEGDFAQKFLDADTIVEY